jgi:hypothetical protein
MPFKIIVVIPVKLEIPVEHSTMEEAQEELERLRLHCPEDTYFIEEVKNVYRTSNAQKKFINVL